MGVAKLEEVRPSAVWGVQQSADGGQKPGFLDNAFDAVFAEAVELKEQTGCPLAELAGKLAEGVVRGGDSLTLLGAEI